MIALAGGIFNAAAGVNAHLPRTEILPSASTRGHFAALTEWHFKPRRQE